MTVVYHGPMFSIDVLHVKCNDWEMKREFLMHSVRKNQLFVSPDRPYDAATDFHEQVIKKKQFITPEEIEDLFGDELELFYDTLPKGKGRGKIGKSWFEGSAPGQFHQVHQHGTRGYSVVLYVDYDVNEHLPTHFIAPFNDMFRGRMIHYMPEDVAPGSMIFFPSDVLHYTMPNMSKKPRLIFSFNIVWTEPT